MSHQIIAAKTASLPYKNLSAALLFSLFFGPLGLLYASLWGGIIMILIGFVVVGSKLPVPIIIMWISCSIWSVISTNRYNNNMLEERIKNNHEEKNYSSSDSV